MAKRVRVSGYARIRKSPSGKSVTVTAVKPHTRSKPSK